MTGPAPGVLTGGGLLLLAILAGLPVGAAAPEGAIVEPSLAVPGATLHFVFTTPSPGPVDVALQRSATCTVVGPGGGVVLSCDDATRLVVVEATPGTTTYAWDVPAPMEPGDYTVQFAQTDLLSLPPASPTGEARFAVTPDAGLGPEDEPLQPGSTGGTAERRTFIFHLINAAAPFQPSEDAAPVRWVLSILGGAGSLILLILSSRHGGVP